MLKRWFLFIVLALALVGPSIGIAHAEYTVRVTASALNVRTGPSTAYSKIGLVYRDQYYVVVGSSGSWRKIWYNSRTGWVHGNYVTSASRTRARVTASWLNVRTGPGTNYSKVGAAPRDSWWAIGGSSGAWRKIHFAGAARWVHGGYLSTSGSTPPPPPPPSGAKVPSKYNYQSYLNGDSRARGRKFSIAKLPTRGVHVIEVFIPDAWVDTGIPAIHLGISAIWNHVEGKGDGRGHDKNFDPSRTRAFIVLNWEKGEGYIISNFSQIRVPTVCVPFTSICHYIHQTFDARAIEYGARNGHAWITWKADGLHFAFTFRYHLQNSVWGSELLGCAIDHRFTFHANGTVSVSGDSYPSVGVYRYPHDGGPVRIEKRLTATKLSGLCDFGG